MSRTRRKYRGKDIEMLLALLILIGYIKERQKELGGYLTTLTLDAIIDLEKRVNRCLDVDLNVKNGLKLAGLTRRVNEIYDLAEGQLGILESLIDMKFKTDPYFVKDMKLKFGFTEHLKRVREQDDQEALINLLLNFKASYPEYDKAFTNKGINPTIAETLVTCATKLKEADVEQEQLKENTPALNQEKVIHFNAIYEEVMDLCRFAKRVYHDQPNVKKKFAYTSVLKRMNLKHVTQEEAVEEM